MLKKETNCLARVKNRFMDFFYRAFLCMYSFPEQYRPIEKENPCCS